MYDSSPTENRADFGFPCKTKVFHVEHPRSLGTAHPKTLFGSATATKCGTVRYVLGHRRRRQGENRGRVSLVVVSLSLLRQACCLIEAATDFEAVDLVPDAGVAGSIWDGWASERLAHDPQPHECIRLRGWDAR